MVGRALVGRLRREFGASRISAPSRAYCDLRNPGAVDALFRDSQPQLVYVAAGTVGGILANQSRPAEFIADNILIAANVIGAAHRHGVEKLVYLGSSCAYPALAEQPIKESALLTGMVELTNEAYAVAKIAGVKLCEAYRRQYGCDFVSVMPTNLYGPGDTYDTVKSHVVPALIDKMHRAKVGRYASVEVWGSGRPMREFLHVDDLADALIHVAGHYSDVETVNIGFGEDVSVRDLAWAIKDAVGYEGSVRFNPAMPDGVPRKLLDSSKLRALGWAPRIGLKEGLVDAYADYLKRFGGAA